MKSEIAILLATYNGAPYLKEQLDSLMAQTRQDWHLYVHDDGSRDATLTIVNDYANRYPGKVTILDYPSTGGACSNFLSLMEKTDASYYMFCDQDDVWLPEKIELSMREMERAEREHPEKAVVVHTDLRVVTEKLSTLSESMWEHAGIYPQYVKTFADSGGHTAIATGCTMLFNDEAKRCCNVASDKTLMHDSWVCLCVLSRGGVLRGVKEKTVLYRQHGSNTLGATGTKATDIGLRYRLLNIKKVFRSNRRYYAMLSSLGYGSVVKYLYSKVKYKMRIRHGYY